MTLPSNAQNSSRAVGMPGSGEGRAQALLSQLETLKGAVFAEEAAQRAKIDAALARHRKSATNLAHYLGLRSADVRDLQLYLAGSGLSSLGRSEGHVNDTLLRVAAWLAGDRAAALAAPQGDALDWRRASHLLRQNTVALFGSKPSDRHVYIMVTAPDSAELSPRWADEVVAAGADLLRINGAHGSPAEWLAIATAFRSSATAHGSSGRVIVDLPGPKLRAEIRELDQGVVRARRKKDRLGRTTVNARCALAADTSPGGSMPVPAEWLQRLEPGDTLVLRDSGGRRRRLAVERDQGTDLAVSSPRSFYLTEGLAVAWRRNGKLVAEGRVGAIAPEPRSLSFSPGDHFLLRGDADGPAREPVLICPEAALLRQVNEGHRVVLDDGKIVAVVEAVQDDGLSCRVLRTLTSPARLRSAKGIAFPDSQLTAGALGPEDEVALAFALEHADAVGVSFVSSAADVAAVGKRIERAQKPEFGMLLKLETRGAVQNLPDILFEALRYHPVGLMIARGDLAVELSFERLAEMQEELLWFGEACHLPVIWATQVLDTLAHSGIPTRAEVTDAAMSMRAECVMLNKGPHIVEAVSMLSDIIGKMESHQYKKRSLYRELSVAKTRGSEPR